MWWAKKKCRTTVTLTCSFSYLLSSFHLKFIIACYWVMFWSLWDVFFFPDFWLLPDLAWLLPTVPNAVPQLSSLLPLLLALKDFLIFTLNSYAACTKSTDWKQHWFLWHPTFLLLSTQICSEHLEMYSKNWLYGNLINAMNLTAALAPYDKHPI